MSFIDKLFRRSGMSRDRSRLMRYDVNQYRFVTWDKKATDLYLIRASVDALARNIAKMQLEAVMYTDRERAEKKVDRTSDVARVLRHPNQYMTQYDFLYKVAAMFYTTNNVFIYPEYKDGRLIALHPINYEDFSIYETENGTLIAKFRMNYYQTYSILYDDLIHLRNHFMTKDLIGDSNGDAIKPITELLTTQNQGIINGIKNSAIIRGILKAANVIKEEDMKAARDRFVEDNLRASNTGGVIGIDGKFEYQNIESKPYIVDAQSVAESKKMIFDYFGITEGFITNAFTPEEYEAIYEGRLEPFAIMLTQGLTHGLYTERELGFGNEIEGNMSKVKYQPISAITALIGATNQLGLFRKNEYREMLGYPPLSDEDGGNDIVISLNYVNNDKLDEYQGVNENE